MKADDRADRKECTLDRYRVIPVRRGGRLTDIRLNTYRNSFMGERGLPEELSDGR